MGPSPFIFSKYAQKPWEIVGAQRGPGMIMYLTSRVMSLPRSYNVSAHILVWFFASLPGMDSINQDPALYTPPLDVMVHYSLSLTVGR